MLEFVPRQPMFRQPFFPRRKPGEKTPPRLPLRPQKASS